MDPNISPAPIATAVTPQDGNIINCRALFVGTGGNLTLITSPGQPPVTLKNVANGQILPIRAWIINATGTSAADIVALF